MRTTDKVAQIGMDIHRNFSKVTARDAQQRILWRQRLEHRQHDAPRQHLARWPAGTPVVLEGSFGWSWLTDELADAGLTPPLASSRKVAAGRHLHGLGQWDYNGGALVPAAKVPPSVDDDGDVDAEECAVFTLLGVGDLNCDGNVDFFDIGPFVLAITDPGAYATTYPGCDLMLGDCNGDGWVDFFDICAFVALLTD